LHFILYTEAGSVWVASEKEVVKYSPVGVEVARISDVFNYISDIAVNSNDGRLFVADKYDNSVSIYDRYGKQLSKNTSFTNPTAVAVDVVGFNAWVADATGLQGFSFDNDELTSNSLSYNTDGSVIEGLAVDQFQDTYAWFAIPQKDIVGLFRNSNPDTIAMPNGWNRPSMISYDNGIAWVADSSRVVAIDVAGNFKASLEKFRFVSSVSAIGSNVWVSDIFAGKVYRFNGIFNVSNPDAQGILSKEPFSSPASVSAYANDKSAWVVDKGRGMVVRLDSLGNKIAFGTGLNQPYIGKTIQKVD
jgi:hypothetical protein